MMQKASSSLSLTLVCLLWYQAHGQSDGDLRLNNFGLSGGTGGRLEIYYNSQWGTVCDDSFGFSDATVACRQLGYSSVSNYGSVGTLGYSQASSSTRTWLDNVGCFGSESRLASCLHNGYGFEDCSHSEDIALRCSGPTTGTLRLNNYGSTGGSSGRLEIYYSSQWGTVCDDSFGFSDANVACRQLGYPGASSYGRVGTLGFSQASSSTPTWLDNVACSGSESRLASCPHNGYGIENCVHFDDIALHCTSIPTSTTTTFTNTFSAIGAIIGGIVGGVVLLIVAVIVCIVCCVCCAAAGANSRSRRTVQTTQPPTTSANVVTYTTAQGTTAYPTQQATYPSGPQQPPPSAYLADPQQPPPDAYPTQQDPYKEPVNPEFSAGAPPGYGDFSAYPPPANPYPPTDPNAPPTAPMTGYPPTGDPTAGYPGYPTGEQYPPQTY